MSAIEFAKLLLRTNEISEASYRNRGGLILWEEAFVQAGGDPDLLEVAMYLLEPGPGLRWARKVVRKAEKLAA